MKRRSWPAKLGRNVATLEERRRGAVATVQRIEAMVSEVSAHLAKLKAQLESAAAEKQQRESGECSPGRTGGRVDGGARSRAANATASCRKSCRPSASALVELEEALKTAREALDAARDRRGELSAEQARVQSDVQHMSETCVQELSQQREELMADESLPRVAGEELVDRRRRPIAKCARASRTWVR